ncbi:MAG: hypothetical protein JRJ65_12505 [Deltaproteobacteria bacterium]|nr:hypothetical protein [Deltaproteobacteria bacterium]
MNFSEEFFLCDKCENRDFKRIYNFSIRFHGVNFADENIYDKLTNNTYQCTKCGKTFTEHQIDERMNNLKIRGQKSV